MVRVCLGDESGPDEVGRVVREILSFVLDNKEAFDPSLAEAGAQMTLERLSKICNTCSTAPIQPLPETNLVDANPVILNEGPIARPGKHEQRQLHLLRLISCKLSHTFNKHLNPRSLDRQVSVGLDMFLRRLLTMPVYTQLNEQAQRILLVSGKDDETVLRTVMESFMHRQFFTNILVRFGLAFRNFDVARHLLMRDLNECRPVGTPELGKDAFHMIMGALLSDILLMAKSQRKGALLDYQFGARSLRGLNEVGHRLAKDQREI